jgi:hypothetical protein
MSMPTPNAPPSTDPSFGFESLLEAQTRLWNHLLDANRSFWSFYTPWLPTGTWPLNTAVAPDNEAEVGTEPATTADGIPDAFELQTRSWNRFLDAHRSFWTSLNWPVPPTPWTTAANEDDGASDAEPNVIDVDQGPVSTKPASAKKSHSGSAAKSRRSSRAR